MTFDQIISFPSYIMFQHFDDEAVLLDIRTQMHYGLNPLGAQLISLIQEGKSLQDAYEALLNEYDVMPEQLEKDIHTLLDTLLEHQLIEFS